MSDTPPYAPLWAGIRPKLREMKKDYAALVYLYLHTKIDRRTGQCNPSVATIAEELGIRKLDTVRAALKQLERIGAMTRQCRPGATDNFGLPVLDIREVDPSREMGAPAKRESSRKTGGESSRERGGESSRKTGAEEESIEEESKKKGEGAAPPAAAPPVTSQAESEIPAASTEPTPPASDQASSPSAPECLLTRLAGWYGYGKDGEQLHWRKWKDLKPSATNWFHAGVVAADPDAPSKISPDATELQVAAYAAYTLNRIRAHRGHCVLKLSGEALRGRRRRDGVVDKLLAERGPAETARLVGFIVDNLDAVMEAIAYLPEPPAIDAGLFQHKAVRRAAERLMEKASDDEREAVYLGDPLDLEKYL